MKRVVTGILGVGCVLGLAVGAQAAPSGPVIEKAPSRGGMECRRIATGATDHGEDNAQAFADELLAGDIKAFKKKHGIRKIRIYNRFRKCEYYLWFFGDEYKCTSAATICWRK